MKIAIDARLYDKTRGGIGRYSRSLLRELAKIDKFNQYYIYLTPQGEKEYNIKSKNFHKIVIPITHYSISEQTKLLKILDKEKYDLVHFINFNHPILYRGKFIVTIHDLTMMLYPAGREQKSFIKKTAFNWVMKNAVKRAKKIITVSQATKNDLVKILGAVPKKIAVIYEGVDSSYQKKNNKLKADNSKLKTLSKYKIQKPYLLFVSQWRPHKGILQLIKAFEILKKNYPTSSANRGLRGASKIPHELVIVGKPNQDFPEIPYAIEHSPHTKDIITPGFVEEKNLPTLYQYADLFVFPSHYEGFGLPPLEAMACGTAVVSSNTSCMPEILGNSAVYFDPYDPLNMAKKTYLVLYNQGLKRDIIKKGLVQAKKYSWSKMAKDTLKIYHSMGH